MTKVQVTLNLPDNVASRARDAGLLTPEALERMVAESVRREAVDRMFATLERLDVLDEPPLSPEEIVAEVAAARAERRRAAGA